MLFIFTGLLLVLYCLLCRNTSSAYGPSIPGLRSCVSYEVGAVGRWHSGPSVLGEGNQ